MATHMRSSSISFTAHRCRFLAKFEVLEKYVVNLSLLFHRLLSLGTQGKRFFEAYGSLSFTWGHFLSFHRVHFLLRRVLFTRTCSRFILSSRKASNESSLFGRSSYIIGHLYFAVYPCHFILKLPPVLLTNG